MVWHGGDVMADYTEQDMLAGFDKGTAAIAKLHVANSDLMDQLLAENSALKAQVASLSGGTPGGTTPTVVAVPRNRVAVIGSAPVADNVTLISASLTGQPAAFAVASCDGRYNRYIANSDPTGNSTISAIRDLRAAGKEPDLWIMDLGRDMDATAAEQAAGDTSRQQAQVNQVLAELGPTARVMWVAIATQWSYPSSYLYHEKVNALFKASMAARGKYGYFADLWAWNRDNRGAAATVTDAQKWSWLSGQADAFMDSATTTTTTATNVVDTDYTTLLPRQ